MTRPIVVFDIDGVLADFTYGFTELLEGEGRHQGTQKAWHFDAPQDEVNAAWKHIEKSTSFWYDLPLLITTGEIDQMHRLTRHFDLVYMTGREDRGNETHAQTVCFLADCGLPFGPVILQGDKLAAVRALDGEVVGIIDDKPETVAALYEAKVNVYCRDWQYNRVSPSVPYFRRVSSVSEFVAYMMELA